MTDSFVFYKSFWEALNELDPDDRLACYDAICAYALTGEEPESTGTVKAVFKLVRPNIDANQRKKEAGRKGGEAKAKQTVAEAKQNVAPIEKTSSNEDEDEDVDEDVDVDEEVDGDAERREKKREKRKRFVPPSLAEVQQYCAEKGLSVDPRQFWEYFDTGDWKDSKGQKVKNWKQKLLTWEKYSPARAAPAWGERDIVSEWMNA